MSEELAEPLASIAEGCVLSHCLDLSCVLPVCLSIPWLQGMLQVCPLEETADPFCHCSGLRFTMEKALSQCAGHVASAFLHCTL